MNQCSSEKNKKLNQTFEIDFLLIIFKIDNFFSKNGKYFSKKSFFSPSWILIFKVGDFLWRTEKPWNIASQTSLTCVWSTLKKVWILTNKVVFFNCYLTAPRPTLSHYQRGSLTHPMLIITFSFSDPKVTGSFVTRLGLYTRSSA